MGKPPKHKITNYFTSKELDLQTSEGQLRDEFKELFEFIGEKVVVKAGKLTTDPFTIESIAVGFEEGLGKVFYLHGTDERQIPLKVPTEIVETDNGIALVYSNKALDNPDVLFKLSRTDKKIREDSRIEIVLAD
ncbi:hypothetical protein KAJ27_08875 [bacterium]|nr:hypothetical protein [bacterium]